ncbi:MAG: tartrate dehydrogenase, partial [Planctomycetales bacterium]|nr:tartrate dehydrogenase [Planctomycetales bacterium]
MSEYRIAVYPGDGIGQEVAAAAVEVLRRVEETTADLSLTLETIPWGVEYWRKTGRVAPEDFLAVLKSYDALFLGAVGWPAELPDSVTLAPLVQIRQAFDQYACVRPARLLPGVPSLLSGKQAGDIDMIVIRENSEGEYVDVGGRLRRGTPEEYAVQSALHTRKGIERILRYGFDLARRRRGRLTMITKSNAMKYGYVLWDEILEELTPQYADVQIDKQHCDAAAMNMIRRPEAFDVIVA